MKKFLKYFFVLGVVFVGLGSSMLVFADNEWSPREKAMIEACEKECDAGDEDCEKACQAQECLELNTSFPFIGRFICVEREQVFPQTVSGLTTIVLVLWFTIGVVVLIAWGVLIASSGWNQGRFDKWKDLVFKVLLAIVLLGLAGVLLHMINPNFFQ